MAYHARQKCPHCSAEVVTFGLHDAVTNPGSGDNVYDKPRVHCHNCGNRFNAVSSNVPFEGCVYAVGPAPGSERQTAVESHVKEVRLDASGVEVPA